jgi:hypothetical protein
LFSFSIEQLMNSMSINKHWLFDIYDLFVFVFWSKHRRNQYDEFCKIRRVTWSFSFVLLSKTRRRTKEKRNEYDENIWFIWCIIDRQQEQEKEEEKKHKMSMNNFDTVDRQWSLMLLFQICSCWLYRSNESDTLICIGQKLYCWLCQSLDIDEKRSMFVSNHEISFSQNIHC